MRMTTSKIHLIAKILQIKVQTTSLIDQLFESSQILCGATNFNPQKHTKQGFEYINF